MNPQSSVLAAVVACSIVAVPTPAGPVFDEIRAFDAGNGDEFGGDVDVSESRGVALIGARFDATNGPESGAAYAHQIGTGNQMKYLVDMGLPYDDFGCAVSMNFRHMLIGAEGDDQRGEDAGAAYSVRVPSSFVNGSVISLDPDARKLVPADGVLDPGDNYGHAVAVDRTFGFAIIGAPGDDGVDNQDEDTGAAYLANLDFANANVIKYTVPRSFDNDPRGDLFGSSVAIDEFTVAIGAPFDALAEGVVYVYERNVNPPIEPLVRITSPDPNVGEMFGASVAMRRDPMTNELLLFVGAPGNDFRGTMSGAVHVFDITTREDPVFEYTIRAQRDNAFAFLGEDVDVSGDRLMIGAPYFTFEIDGQPVSTGAVIEWDLTMPTSETAIYRNCLAEANDAFGFSVAIDGDTFIAGAPGDDAGGQQAGEVVLSPFDVLTAVDCEMDGRLDVCEIADDPSLDCWGPGVGNPPDGVLDECNITGGDGVADCDGNLVPDVCEIADGSGDCDGNGLVDACEINDNGGMDGVGGILDCNANGRLDFCDVFVDGTFSDCDGNEVLDVCEINANGGVDGVGGDLDCNSNGQLDSCDIASGVSMDDNLNGVPDECEGP